MEKSTPIPILVDDPVLARADASLKAKIQQELKFPDPTPDRAKAILSPYGLCPVCGAEGQIRERRLNGNDTCTKGHSYPSREAK